MQKCNLDLQRDGPQDDMQVKSSRLKRFASLCRKVHFCFICSSKGRRFSRHSLSKKNDQVVHSDNTSLA